MEKETTTHIKEIDKKIKRGPKLNELNKPRKPPAILKNLRINRASRYDDLIGPFYTDPELMDKFRSPWKCKYFSPKITTTTHPHFL